MAIGDLDAAHGPDLVVAYHGGYPDHDSGVSVLLNWGDGTFAAAVSYPTGGYSVSVAVGDLDGAGCLDLAVANVDSDDVTVLLNPCPTLPCPWDCNMPADGEVGINDFLAMLSQWGNVGSSCDIDGGGVGVTDFLLILAHWGPCP